MRRTSQQRIAVWVIAAFLLLLPLVVMQFTSEVNWESSDFAIAAVLLFGTLGTYELAARRTGVAAYRTGAGLALAAALLLFWVNGAVGIIGSENNDANLIYYGVIAVGLLGALVARFKPQGMAYAMLAAAIVQASAFVIALVAGWGFTGPITVFFLALWLGSAWLFQKSAQEGVAPPA